MREPYFSRRKLLSATGSALALSAAGNVSGQEIDDREDDPDLETLRDRWFLDFDGNDVAFPSSERHSKNDLEPYVSASVEPLYDGATFMERFHDTVTDMAENYPEQSEVYHQTWKLGDPPLLGAQREETAARDVIKSANDAGVDMNIMISGNVDNPPLEGLSAVRDIDIDTAAVDTRYPETGSIHQKFTVFRSPAGNHAMVGSADLYAERWGRRPHEPDDPDRPTDTPNHDLTVWLSGPVVRELQKVYLTRWNDDSRDDFYGDLGRGRTPPKIDPSPIEADEEGDQQVQILQTYGKNSRSGYSWREEGEFTVWAAYLNALQQAREYVYIEDQFFMPEGAPPWYEQGGAKRESSLYYQMAQALRRGVDVLVLTEGDGYLDTIVDQRHQGIEYLTTVAENAPGDFSIAYLSNGEETVYVHSKLMMVDDEVTFIGSSNVVARSKAHDAELQLAIIDEKNEFTQEMRTELWRGYLDYSQQEASQELADPTTGIETFKRGVQNETGLLRAYEHEDTELSWPQQQFFTSVVDPYAGPDHDENADNSSPCLVTGEPTDVSTTRATLTADIEGDCLADEDSADQFETVLFAYRAVDDTAFEFTESITVDAGENGEPVAVEVEITGLEPGTDYEYKVVTDQRLTARGGWEEFETDSESGGGGPGFTIPAAAAGVGGATLLHRYRNSERDE